MFNELDELLQLTKLVEATSTNQDTETEEEDLPAAVRVYDDDYSGKFKTLTTRKAPEVFDDEIPQKPKDGKAYGSSGNATFRDKEGKAIENGPLFEEDGPTMTEDDTAELDAPSLEEGDEGIANTDENKELIGNSVNEVIDGAQNIKDAIEKSTQSTEEVPVDNNTQPPADTQCMSSIGKSLKRGMSFSLGESVEKGMGSEFVNKYMFECCSGACCCRENPFKLGDAVQVAGIPRIFIVKNNDGNMITTAKPTNCQADFAKGKDGVWPEYCFQCNELSRVDNAGLDQADELAEFNDRDIDTTGFNGLTIDARPMEIAQDYAREMTMDDVADNLDEILGAYRSAASGNDNEFSYTKCSPGVTYVLPSGEITTQCIEGGYEKRF